MAEDTSKPTHPATPIIALLAVLLALSFISGLFKNFQERFGPNISSFFSGEIPMLPLDPNTSIGSEIITNDRAPIFRSPGDRTAISYISKGLIAKVIDGPSDLESSKWWRVKFENGAKGWVLEEFLSTPGKNLARTFANFIKVLKTVSTYLSLIFLTLLIYAYVQLTRVKVEQNKKYQNHYEPDQSQLKGDERWQKINLLIDSDNQNDWKQAIIEADILLEELLEARGHDGQGVGEKLKIINPKNLSSLDSAWEAHKIRNRIAHSGGDFVLTQGEAKRTVNLYAVVFREFGFFN